MPCLENEIARLSKKGRKELAGEVLKIFVEIWIDGIDMRSRSILRVCNLYDGE